MFPAELIESKIDKREISLMNSTKNSFFTKPILTENSDDIEEDLYGSELPDNENSSSLSENSPNYFTNYLKTFLPFN